MRVLFATIPEKSHLFCMTPMAWALRAAGHEVRIASSPGFADVIAATGLTAVGVGDDGNISTDMAAYRESQETELANWSDLDPAGLSWATELERMQVGAWGFGYYNEPMVDDLVDFARAWRPDLVVWDPLTYAGPLAAGAVGAAHARSMCFADVWVAKRSLFAKLRADVPADQQQDPMAEWLGARAALLGGAFTEELVTGQVTLDPLPTRLGANSDVARQPIRFVPYNGRAVEPPWLAAPADRPRVCLSLGNANSERYGGDYVSKAEILAALAEEDVEVVAALLKVQIDELGTVPDNVRVVESVPLHSLLASCSVLIHHGGFGSYATALVNGTPQLMVATPISDQQLRGRGLHAEQAGLMLDHRAADAQSVRDGVVRLVADETFARNAQRLRDEALAHPSPADVVANLVDLVADRTTAPWSARSTR